MLLLHCHSASVGALQELGRGIVAQQLENALLRNVVWFSDYRKR